MDRRKIYFLIILAIGSLIFFFNLGGRDLWEPDETRYAVIAREMSQSGEWILPHLNRAIYAEKPPLFFWLINLSTFFWGTNNEVTNRLPSALAGIAVLLITFLLGSKLFNPQTGFLSAMILSTCVFFPQISRWAMLDSLVTLFFILTLYYFYRGYEEEESRRKDYLWAGLFMGLGVLTKGPLAYLAIPIFLIFALFQKSLKRVWCRDLLWGCLLSVGIVLIWWIPACWIGGKEYIHWILFKQVTGTYVEGGKHFHPQTFSFYFIRFPLEFFPWIVFLPTALILGFKKGRGKGKEILFLLIWFIFIFLFFTFAKGKKDNYLLPLYPAAALLVGNFWNSGLHSSERKKGIVAGIFILAFLFFIGSVLFFSGIPRKFFPDIAGYQSLGLSVLVYLLVGSFLALVLFMKKRKWASFIGLMVTFTILHLHFSFTLPQRLNPLRSMKAFSESILKRMEVGDELKTYWFQSKGLIYYTQKPYIEEIENKKQLLEVLGSSQKVFIVFHKEVFDHLMKDLNLDLHPLDEATVSHWNYVLVSNH
jgi:4-amino-4-deoxy-L-arabinose transferase-like glycosyltransferase